MSISELKEQGIVYKVMFTSSGLFRVLFRPSAVGKMPKLVNTCEAPKGLRVIADFDNLQLVSEEDENTVFPMCGTYSEESNGRYAAISLTELEKYNIVKVILPYYDVHGNKLLDNHGIRT